MRRRGAHRCARVATRPPTSCRRNRGAGQTTDAVRTVEPRGRRRAGERARPRVPGAGAVAGPRRPTSDAAAGYEGDRAGARVPRVHHPTLPRDRRGRDHLLIRNIALVHRVRGVRRLECRRRGIFAEAGVLAPCDRQLRRRLQPPRGAVSRSRDARLPLHAGRQRSGAGGAAGRGWLAHVASRGTAHPA